MPVIWFKKDIQLSDFASVGKGTMSEHRGIEFTEIGDNYLKATMPVDGRTTNLMVYCMVVQVVYWQKRLEVLLPCLLLITANLFVLGVK